MEATPTIADLVERNKSIFVSSTEQEEVSNCRTDLLRNITIRYLITGKQATGRLRP